MTGIPTPSATWYYGDDIVIKPSASTSIETGATYTTLIIGRVAPDIIGQYKVVVENPIGSDSAEFDVTVKGL